MGSNAFLVGNAIFGSVNKELCGSDEAYDRENTERNGEESIAVADIVYGRFELTAYILGDVAAATTAICRERELVEDLYVKDYGICRLDHSGRRAVTAVVRLGLCAEAIIRGLRLKDVYMLLASEKNYLLVDRGDSFEFLRLIASDASLECDL